MPHKLAALFLFSILSFQLQAQNLERVKAFVDTLCADSFHGRGYVNNANEKSAHFIARHLKGSGMDTVFLQNFYHPINRFPADLSLEIDGTSFEPGKDFIAQAHSGSIDKELHIIWLPPKQVKNIRKFKKWMGKQNWQNSMLVIPEGVFLQLSDKYIGEALTQNIMGADALVFLKKKLTASVRGRQLNFAGIEMLANVFPENARKANLKITAELVPNFHNRNVIAWKKGTEYPDSFIVFSAHYDHLGRMGEKACFAGANDNAGGVAALLDLAAYYGNNPQKYSIAFIAFGAEEAGLLGSAHFVRHPEIELDNISTLWNLDLVTNGQDGAMVVNGRVFKSLFSHLERINKEKGHFERLKKRGKAANSDHYWFSEKGVRSFFIYLMGDYPHYHDVYDTPEKPSWKGYVELIQLLKDFVSDYQLDKR